MRRLQAEVRKGTFKAAMNYTQAIYDKLGQFDVRCMHCGAIHFPEERVQNNIGEDSFNDCCCHGKISLAEEEYDPSLQYLFLKGIKLRFKKEFSGSEHQENFFKYIRNYNSALSMASFCPDKVIDMGHGIPCYKIQGIF
jgi:hypothetical protein